MYEVRYSLVYKCGGYSASDESHHKTYASKDEAQAVYAKLLLCQAKGKKQEMWWFDGNKDRHLYVPISDVRMKKI